MRARRVRIAGERQPADDLAADFGNELEAMLHACKRAHSVRDSCWFSPSQPRRRYSREHIFQVVRARQRNRFEMQYCFFLAFMAKQNFASP